MMNSLNPLCTMKTNKLIAAALLPLLFSCAKENINQNDITTQGGFDISITAISDAPSKAIYDDEKGILWANPGKAGLVKKDGTTAAFSSSESVSVSDDKQKATFSFSGITTDYYRLYYPYTDETYYRNIKFAVPRIQHSTPGLSSDIIAGVASEDVHVQESYTNDATVKFLTVGSYIKFAVYGIPGIKVHSIQIEANEGLGGFYMVDPNKDDKGKIYYTNITHYDNTLVVEVSGGYLISEKDNQDTAKGIYASVLPGTYTNLVYKVITDEGDYYTFKPTLTNSFEEGTIKQVNLNLSNTKCESSSVPSKLYLFGGATLAGWNQYNPIPMTYDSETKSFSANVYLEKELNGSPTDGFKFLTRQGFYEGTYVKDEQGKMKYYEVVSEADDQKFTAPGNGYYTVTANFNDMSVSVVPAVPEKIYLVGGSETAYSWTPSSAIEMTKEGNIFKARAYLIPTNNTSKNGYKFLTSSNSWTGCYVSVENFKAKYYSSPSADNDIKFTVNDAGWYDVILNLDPASQDYGKVLNAKCADPIVLVNNNESYTMLPTGKNVFTTSKLIPAGSGNHDFSIKNGDKYYYTSAGGWLGVSFDQGDNSSSYKKEIPCDYVGFDAGRGWYIVDEYDNLNYRFILDLNSDTEPKLTLEMIPGTEYWLVGLFNGGNKNDEYKGNISNEGLVTWEITTTISGDWFYILGASTADEKYFSTNRKKDYGSDNFFSFNDDRWPEGWGSLQGVCFNSSGQSWTLDATGKFKITFDIKKLKIKVEKVQQDGI